MTSTQTKSTVVRIAGDPKPYTLTVVDEAAGGDSSVSTVELTWTHGIYRTHESARFTIFFTAVAGDYLIHPDGRIEDLREDLDPLHAAIGRGMARLV